MTYNLFRNIIARIAALLSAVFFIFVSCASDKEALQPQNFTDVFLLSQMNEFDILSQKTNAPVIDHYFRSYYEVIPDLKIHSGFYYSGDELLAAHLLYGRRTNAGTAIMIHGYAGSVINTHFEYFAQQFIEQGHRVVLLDLPGHEFSGGYRSSVHSFSEYSDMVINFISKNKNNLGKAVYAVGISIGAVAFFDAMRKSADVQAAVTKTVLVVPFLKTRFEGAFVLGSYLASSIHSGQRGPLRIYNQSTYWIRKAKEWRKSLSHFLQKSPPLDGKNVFIAFAAEDKIIKTSLSRNFYSAAFSGAAIKTYANQDHMISKDGYKQFRTDVMHFLLNL